MFKKSAIFLIFAIFLSDKCFTQEYTILHTNDIHGRIGIIDYKEIKNLGGLSRRVEFFNSMKKNEKNVLIFDSGDYHQGSIYSIFFKNDKIFKLMKYSKYDAKTFGNHEFDKDIKEVKKLVKASKTPFVSTNLEFSDKFLKKNVKKYLILNVDGEKILVLGATTPDLSILTKTGGIKVLDTFSELNKIIKEQNIENVILLSHCGVEFDKEIAKNVEGIDIILGGHNHYFLKYPQKVNDTLIFQNGEFGVEIGKIEYDFKDKLKNFEQVFVTSEINENVLVKNKIKILDKKLEKMRQKTISTTEIMLMGEQIYLQSHQSNLAKLILNSIINSFNDFDIIIINSGSIRINKNLIGKISYAEALEILPFEDKIAIVKISGKNIKEVLNQGKTPARSYLQVFDKTKNYEDEKIYTLITTKFVAGQGDGYKNFENAQNIYITDFSINKIFLDYLKNHPIINEKVIEN